MEAIVLAGGFGTRLRQLVADVPKPMAPIAGRPFLEILLGSLARKGFRRVTLSLGFMAEKISDHFGANHAGIDLVYVVEEQPLGTGGGVRLAMEQVTADHVFVFNGDTFLDLESERVEQQWQTRRRPLIVGREVPDTARYGRLLAQEGRAMGFTEKGVAGPGLINAGCYVLQRQQLASFPAGRPFSLEADFLGPAVARGEFDVFVTSGQFIDIGVPEDYLRAQTELAGLKGMSNAALFLDRDGVINVDHGYVHRAEDFEFIPGIFELVRAARSLEYKVIVVTNQAGIGRGYYTEAQFHDLTRWMRQRFKEQGAGIDAVYFCPFHPEHGVGLYRRESELRKPNPGMLLQAARDWDLDLGRCVLVGDKMSDIAAAVSAGVPTRFLYRSTDDCLGANSIQDLAEATRFFRAGRAASQERAQFSRRSSGISSPPSDAVAPLMTRSGRSGAS